MHKTLLAASLALLCACDGQAKKTGQDVNYMADEGMDAVMQTFRDALGAERPIVALSIARDLATIKPADRGEMEVRLDKPHQYDGSGEKGFPGVPLASLDPKAARDKLMSLSGCTAPAFVGIGTYANGKLHSHLLCDYQTPQAAFYTLDGQGSLLGELDLKSGEGIAAAWQDIYNTLPDDARITILGLSFPYPGGQILVNTDRHITLRFGTREKHDNPLLVQSAQPIETQVPANYVRAGDLKPDAFRRILAQTKAECGDVNVITLEVGRERGAHILAGIIHQCVIKTDLDGNILPPGK